jgi:hypothetical protein
MSAKGHKEKSARKMAAAGHRLERAASGSCEKELIPRTLIGKRKSGRDTIDTEETRGRDHHHRVTSSDLKWCCERYSQ